MPVNQEPKVILKQIDICRRELNTLISNNQRTSAQVLRISQKLDKLILEYYQKYN